MLLPLIQSAINISEGRRPEILQAIVRAAESSGVTVADWSADIDHNRMVITLLGDPTAIRHGALAVGRIAVEQIDLRGHSGAHPRMGAVDVVPVTPIQGITMEECVLLSKEIAEDFADKLGVPVYLYEKSARPGRRAALPAIRKGGFEGLFSGPLAGNRAPDVGPHQPHATAGVTVVGARSPLIAYNINLDSNQVSIARQIAAAIREQRDTNPALTGVRALGFWLASQKRAQVSLNLTRPDLTPMPAIFDFVREQAAQMSANVYESEIVGLAPRSALDGQSPERILWRDFRETQLVDLWLEKLRTT